ncbi:MAG: hypothetical protein ACTSQ8_23710 [Candidatus Helarchaeota archaeon]
MGYCSRCMGRGCNECGGLGLTSCRHGYEECEECHFSLAKNISEWELEERRLLHCISEKLSEIHNILTDGHFKKREVK